MSYWAWVEIDTGGTYNARVEDSINMTSNVSPMWAAALGFAFRDLNGMNCAEAAPHLERAVAYLRDEANQEALEAMAPDNGWGTVEGATNYLVAILGWCTDHPKAQIGMSH